MDAWSSPSGVLGLLVPAAALGLFVACRREAVSGPGPAQSPAVVAKGASANGCDWAAFLGKTVAVEGTAVNAKLGALLLVPCGSIWIAGLDSWPSGFHRGGRDGKRVRVTGIVRIRADMPVFTSRPGEPQRAGIPVPPGTDLDEARRRFVLEGARWSAVE
jgi:hypothetical protein